eukprot:2741996-Pyramimonas_sp.AAC.1
MSAPETETERPQTLCYHCPPKDNLDGYRSVIGHNTASQIQSVFTAVNYHRGGEGNEKSTVAGWSAEIWRLG